MYSPDVFYFSIRSIRSVCTHASKMQATHQSRNYILTYSVEEYSTGSKIPNLSFFQVSINLDSDHAKCFSIRVCSSAVHHVEAVAESRIARSREQVSCRPVGVPGVVTV